MTWYVRVYNLSKSYAPAGKISWFFKVSNIASLKGTVGNEARLVNGQRVQQEFRKTKHFSSFSTLEIPVQLSLKATSGNDARAFA